MIRASAGTAGRRPFSLACHQRCSDVDAMRLRRSSQITRRLALLGFPDAPLERRRPFLDGRGGGPEKLAVLRHGRVVVTNLLAGLERALVADEGHNANDVRVSCRCHFVPPFGIGGRPHENAADFGGEASISLPCSLEENVLDVMRQTNAYRFS